MPALDRDRLARDYPYLWHVTRLENLLRIERTRRLESAAALMRAAGDCAFLRKQRDEDKCLRIGDDEVWLREQSKLNEANAAWEGGWGMPEFLEALNSRVFFWPGTHDGVVRTARENFRSFLDAGGVPIRIRYETVRHLSGIHIQYSRFNAGAPRQNDGKPIPRGPRTFLAHGAWEGGSVREVVVVNRLPLDEIWTDVRIG
jgi:hypothetical protein